MSYLIGSLRAIVEMLGLCLLAQGLLYILAGRARQANPIYRLFALITRLPRRITAGLLPWRASEAAVAAACFVILLLLWLGLAWTRKFI